MQKAAVIMCSLGLIFAASKLEAYTYTDLHHMRPHEPENQASNTAKSPAE